MGRTREAYAEQEAALALTTSPSVMTRALLEMDAAACLNADGDSAGAADKAVGIWETSAWWAVSRRANRRRCALPLSADCVSVDGVTVDGGTQQHQTTGWKPQARECAPELHERLRSLGTAGGRLPLGDWARGYGSCAGCG
jgi:hypothetical protein